MKTAIDLSQFDFGSRIFNQISDCPDTGFVRVLVYNGDNYQESIKKWFLNAEIVFINQNNNKIVYKRVAKSKNEDWVISNGYRVTVLDLQGQPIPNPNFKTEDEEGNTVSVSESNLPFVAMGAFDVFSEFRVGSSYSMSMRDLWNISVTSDDYNGYFDDKENYKGLIDIQLEFI